MNFFLRQILLYGTLFLLFSSTVTAQNFISGRIITSAGDTLPGYIDYNLWPITPQKISFRVNKTVTKYSPEELQGFQILRKDGFWETYRAKAVEIDVSNQSPNDLTESPTPKMETKTLFLKLFLSGPLTLYYHKDGRQKAHYFIEKTTGEIEALEQRKYRKKVGDDWQIATSIRYKNQLMIMTNDCDKKMDASSVKYAGTKIKSYLVRYFDCIGAQETYNFKREQQKPSFYVLAGGGVIRTRSWGIGRKDFLFGTNIGSKSKSKTPTFGLGAGVDLPISKKFSFYGELFVNNYAFKDSLHNFINEEYYFKIHADFKSVNAKIKAHFRYHFLFEPSQLIFSFGPSFNYSLMHSGSSFYLRKFYSSYDEFPLKTSRGLNGFGLTLNVGYHYKQFGVELKLETGGSNSSSLETSTSWRSIELVGSYRLNKSTVKMNK